MNQQGEKRRDSCSGGRVLPPHHAWSLQRTTKKVLGLLSTRDSASIPAGAQLEDCFVPVPGPVLRL